jgi:hypothetical protein
MAEEVGFEPTVDFHLRRFSRPVHSTTLPLLRRPPFNPEKLILKPLKIGKISPNDCVRSFHRGRYGLKSIKNAQMGDLRKTRAVLGVNHV